MRVLRAGIIGVWTVAATAVFAAEDPEQMRRGEELLRGACSSCHAVATSDTGKHESAPPFRTLSRKYPIDALEEALAEGIVSGHPDMPEFKFEPPDVGAIIAYLKTIQVK